MKKNIIFSSIMVSMLLLETGCGGGSSSSSTSPNKEDLKKKIGYYLDSAVSGVDYSCAGVADGKTGSDGSFFHTDGACTFSVGGIVLRKVDTSKLEGNIVFEDNPVTARFLQTLDNDGNADNGIQVDVKVSDSIASGDINLNGVVPDNDKEITALVTQLQEKVEAYNGTIITEEEVKSHLSDTSAMINSIEGSITVSSDSEGETTMDGMTTTSTGSSGSSSTNSGGETTMDGMTTTSTGSSGSSSTNSGGETTMDGMTTTSTGSSSTNSGGETIMDGMITSPTSDETDKNNDSFDMFND